MRSKKSVDSPILRKLNILNLLKFFGLFGFIILLAMVLECGLLTNLHEFAHINAAKAQNVTMTFDPLGNFLPCFRNSLTGAAGTAKFATAEDINRTESNLTIAKSISMAGITTDLSASIFLLVLFVICSQLVILNLVIRGEIKFESKRVKYIALILLITSLIISLDILFLVWATRNNLTFAGGDLNKMLLACK